MAISETKGRGWRAATQWRKSSNILTSSLAAFLFSSHPKRERDREAHLNYCASTYNRVRQLSHHDSHASRNVACSLLNTLEHIQHRFTKLISGLQRLTYAERLEKLGLWRCVYRWFRKHVFVISTFLLKLKHF